MRISGSVGMIKDNCPASVSGIVSRLDTAVRLGVSVATVDSLARRGLLVRAYRPGGVRACGFTEQSVATYMTPSEAFCPVAVIKVDR